MTDEIRIPAERMQAWRERFQGRQRTPRESCNLVLAWELPAGRGVLEHFLPLYDQESDGAQG